MRQCFNKIYLKLLWRPCLWQWSDRKEGYHSAAPQGWLDLFVVTQISTPPWFGWCCSGTDRSPPSWSVQIYDRISMRNWKELKENSYTRFSSWPKWYILHMAGGWCHCWHHISWWETAVWFSDYCSTSHCWLKHSRCFPSLVQEGHLHTDQRG